MTSQMGWPPPHSGKYRTFLCKVSKNKNVRFWMTLNEFLVEIQILGLVLKVVYLLRPYICYSLVACK